MKKLFLISLLVFMFSGQVWGEECKYVWVSDSGTTATWLPPQYEGWDGEVFTGWNVQWEFPKWKERHKNWTVIKVWESGLKGYSHEPLWTCYKYCRPKEN